MIRFSVGSGKKYFGTGWRLIDVELTPVLFLIVRPEELNTIEFSAKDLHVKYRGENGLRLVVLAESQCVARPDDKARHNFRPLQQDLKRGIFELPGRSE